MALHLIDASAAGHTVTIKKGDQLMLLLGENPSTGYRWTEPHVDEEVLALTNSHYISTAPKEPHQMMPAGTGGARFYKFDAIEIGTTSLLIYLRRPFEPPEKKAVQTFAATVTIVALDPPK